MTASSSVSVQATRQEGISVLHVDDDRDFAALTADLLERQDEGSTVYTATDARTGLETLVESDVDCVVSDYDMPGMNGLEFLEAVREDHPDLPFILFTGKGSEEVASDAFAAGATDYLPKERGTDQYEVLAKRVQSTVENARSTARQRRHLEAIESAREGIGLLNADGRYTYVNRAYADIFGYEPEELVGRHWETIYTEEGIAFVREEVLPTVEARGYWRGRTTGVRADGSTFPEDHVVAATGDGGLVCTVRDLSEEQQQQELLTRYETILEALNDPVYALDAEGRFTFVNDAFCELVGYDREAVLGAEPSLVKTEDSVAAAEENLRRLCSADGPDSVTFEIEIQPKEGDPIPCEDHMGAIVGEDGHLEASVGVVRDVSGRVERERELERYESIIEAVGDPVYTLDAEGRFTFVNDAMAEKLGYDREELLGAPASVAVTEESMTAANEAIASLLDGGNGPETVTVELEKTTADGGGFVGENHISLLGDGLQGTAGVVRDVSERVERERELKRYESIIEASGDPVYTLDTEGRFTYVNDAFCEVTGYDRAAVIGEHVSLLMPPEDVERGTEMIADLVDGDRDRGTFEMTAVTADGERLVCENHVGLLPGEDGPEGTVGTVRDISGRVERERALEDLHGATRELMTATDAEEVATVGCRTASEVLDLPVNGVHYHDPGEEALVPVAWSEGVEETLGGEPPAIPAGEGLAWEAYEAGEPRVYPDIREADRVFSEDTPFRSELHLPLGEYGVLMAGSTEPDDFDGTDEALARVLAANLETALDRVKHERELARQNERLEEFASIVSHDLRNPLNVAEGHLELAQLEADGEALDHLGSIESAHDRMEGLIEDLLALARHGNAVESPERVSLPVLARECWGTVDTADADLVVETDRTVRAEPGRLKQLLENLLANAVEHGATDGSVTVTVGDHQDGFYVADDGPGVPPDGRESVFEAGYSTAKEGTGFGLRIVRRVAEAHGWTVRVVDSAAGGARFEITGVTGD